MAKRREEPPERAAKAEFERMIARHRDAIERARNDVERVRQELDARLFRLREQMKAATEDFERAIKSGAAPTDAARHFRKVWGKWPDRLPRAPRPPRRPPWRGLHGGEPVPVEPRPKPKPLIDGAEAPIE